MTCVATIADGIVCNIADGHCRRKSQHVWRALITDNTETYLQVASLPPAWTDTSIYSGKVSLHDRCPFIASSLGGIMAGAVVQR